MTRSLCITQLVGEALAPGTKKALKWSAAAAGTVGAGYLAYRHGGDLVHHFTGQQGASPPASTGGGARSVIPAEPLTSPGVTQPKGITDPAQHKRYLDSLDGGTKAYELKAKIAGTRSAKSLYDAAHATKAGDSGEAWQHLQTSKEHGSAAKGYLDKIKGIHQEIRDRQYPR